MIKVSDYIFKRLVTHGVSQLFMISGGGAMHLNDSVGQNKAITYICNHHEQAGAMAAEGYARVTGQMGVVVVTSGPGGTNTLTGVIGQWLDSIPVLYLSGQVKFETTLEACKELGLRQLGDQEINIVDIVRPVTKFAALLTDPLDVKKILDKAVYLARHGRPGPVWIDIPLNVQGAQIEEKDLRQFDPGEDESSGDINLRQEQVLQAVELLRAAKRPVFLAGHGIRLAGAQNLFLQLIDKLGIPVLSTFNGFDLIPSDHPLYIGRIGTIGDRAGNFALQNADLLISVGSRNNIRQVSYNWKCFARAAKKVVVDIDPAELKKPTVVPDIPIQCDARVFLEALAERIEAVELPVWAEWLAWALERKNRYPVVLPSYAAEKAAVNPYYFVQVLTQALGPEAIVVSGNGTASVALFQAGLVKKGQRMFCNSGCAAMGFDLPASIGACLGSGGKKVICLAGDGSFQMNLQELQTVFYHRLPIQIFYLNNQGYVSIRQTQDSFFEGRYVACDESSGVSFPDIQKIAKAYNIDTFVLNDSRDLREKIGEILGRSGPFICEIRLPASYIFSPKLSSEKKPDGRIVSKPLEDMYPFLDRQEFKSNLLIPEWQEE